MLKVALFEPQILASRGRNPINPSFDTKGIPTVQHFEARADGLTNTLTTVQKDNLLATTELRIRRLTPKECWRLMGFSDEDCDKAAKVVSNSQLYKQAGNSIVVPVLEHIFTNLFIKKSTKSVQRDLFGNVMREEKMENKEGFWCRFIRDYCIFCNGEGECHSIGACTQSVRKESKKGFCRNLEATIRVD